MSEINLKDRFLGSSFSATVPFSFIDKVISAAIGTSCLGPLRRVHINWKPAGLLHTGHKAKKSSHLSLLTRLE